ncbi:hypothetical protein Tco_1149454 [Tanacetum coccineum]
MKLATKRSKTQFHSSHISGSGDEVDTQSKVPDEQQQKVTGTNEGAGVTPEVPDVPKYDSESNEESWTFSQDDEDAEEESDRNDDKTKSDEEEEEEEKANDEKVSSDQRVSTPPEYKLNEEEEYKEDDDKDKEERSDAEMTDAQANQDTKDTHVTLTTVPLVVQQQSSSISSDLVSKFINPSSDIGIDSILNKDTQSDTLVNVPVFFDQRVSALEPEMYEFRQTSQFAEAISLIPGIVDSIIKAIINEHVQAQVSKIMPKIKKYVTESLGAEVLVRSTNQPQTSYAVAASLSEFELKKILIDKMETNKSIDRSNIQKNLYNALVESYNTDKDIITSYGDVVTLKRGRDDQDKDKDPSIGSRGPQSSKGASKSQSESSGKSAHAEEHDQKAADLEDQPHQEFNTGNENESPVREALHEDVLHRNPSRPPTPDREWHKTKTVNN